MLKKLILLVVVIVFASNFVYAGPRLTPEQKSKIMSLQSKITVRGDAVIGVNQGNNKFGYLFPRPTSKAQFTDKLPSNSWISSITRTIINTTDQPSMYDLLSNGTPNCVAQNPSSPNFIHAAYMWDNLTDPVAGSTNRRVKYWKTTDKGTTWSFVANVPDLRAGYCAVDIYNTGSATKEIFCNHSANGGGGVRAQCFLDAFEGLGSFTSVEPGDRSFNEIIWPRFVMTSSAVLTNKVILMGSVNSTAFDSSFYSICTATTPEPGTWGQWQNFNGSTAETYKMARGADGRIGFTWIAPDLNAPPDYGDVYFAESTNNGTTFSAPVKIFHSNFTTDSLAGFRGLDIVYLGNSAKVVFETIKQTQANNFFPGFPNNIRFWSPSLPGTPPNNSIIIVDTTSVGYHPAISGGSTNDALAPICRCGIGVSGSCLFVSFMTPFGPSGLSYIGGSPDSNSFNSVWLTASGNGGSSWKAPQMITPFDTTITMKDWTYPSISKWNDTTATTYYVNIVSLMDSIPGSYYSHSGNGYAVSNFMFIRVAVSPIPIGIHGISTEVPGNYSLYQNYPNPFNPTTNIRFALPNASTVSLKIYNVKGQLVETVVNNEKVSAGVNEVKFNASSLSSGIYFYTLQADNYKETKKMMLIK